ncbi:helix-turn-helix transcriptional regulator [Kineothrix sedimenti]|uniref:Helix-turn-helix transcriptional regulator n=1 Tax=Kineothrix sedimenti TaxID=3123317 RepID=A0ABZ3F1I9_9FIRM
MDMYEYIKQALKIRRLNERQLAFLLDKSPQNINRRLKADMKVSFIESIADFLNCDVDIRFIDRYSKRPLI